MGSNTPKGYPYPVGTDRVMDGDNAIQALAEKIDAAQPYATFTGGGSASVSNSTIGTVVITFPSGRFTVPPRVSAAVRATSVFFAYVSSISATAVNVGVRQYATQATTANVYVDVIATQMLADSSDG